jgi:hypothetical protein
VRFLPHRDRTSPAGGLPPILLAPASEESTQPDFTAHYYRPDFPPEAYARCATGRHEDSRTRLVDGWVNWSNHVEHFWCACGEVRWLVFEGAEIERTEGLRALGGWKAALVAQARIDELAGRPETAQAAKLARLAQIKVSPRNIS